MRWMPPEGPSAVLRQAAAITPDDHVPCREDPDLWYATNRARLAMAKRACRGDGPDTGPPCALLDLCRDAARHAREPFGVWGGESAHDRTRHRNQQAAAERIAQTIAQNVAAGRIPIPRDPESDTWASNPEAATPSTN